MTEEITWISVENELPDDDTVVLVVEGDGDVSVGCLEDGKWASGYFGGGWSPVGVSHWAHLPVGPAAKEKTP